MLKVGKIIFCLFFFSVYLNANAITLDEALINAYRTNPELNAQRESLKASDESIMQALAGWLPSVKLQSTKQYNNITSPANKKGATDGSMHQLTITQNLFKSGADLANMKKAKLMIEAARAKLNNTEQEIFLKTIKLYMGTLEAKEKFRISQEKVKESTELLRGTRHRFKAGDATKTDVYLAEAEFSKAKAERSSADRNYKISQANFKAIVGLTPKNLTLPKDNIRLPKSVEDTINISLVKNPTLVSSKNSADAKQKEIAVTRSGVLPSINLEHSISDKTKIGFEPAGGRRNHTTAISLNVPIFEVSNWSTLRRSKREAAAAQNEMTSAIEATKATAIKSWVDLKADKDSLKARRDEHKAYKIAFKGAQAQEKAGLMSTFDVIKVQDNYFTSYLNFISQRSAYYVSLYELKSMVGECTAKGLGLKVEYYDPLKNYNSIKWQLIGAF
jgi:outer membrane protein